MDTNNIAQKIKERFDYDAAKKILKEKYEANMVFVEYGGMFKASYELINLLNCLDEDEVVILDLYGNPCKVNRQELLTKSKQIYQEQLNGWFYEYEEISRER